MAQYVKDDYAWPVSSAKVLAEAKKAGCEFVVLELHRKD